MSWSGVKKQTNIEDIKAWCEEMDIKKYTINSKGEIDVDGDVNLQYEEFEELPYKFGEINGYFSLTSNFGLLIHSTNFVLTLASFPSSPFLLYPTVQ